MSDEPFYYPDLPNLGALRIIDTVRELVQAHPSYFTQSPYSSEVEKLLRSWFLTKAHVAQNKAQKEIQQAAQDDARFDPFTDLVHEIELVYGTLKGSKPQAGEDAIGWSKSATSMLAKLVDLRQQAVNLKAIGDFKQGVMSVLREICTEEQREQFLERLAIKNTSEVVIPTDSED